MIRVVALLLMVVMGSLPEPVRPHEVRPAYLEIRETAPQRYDILWKVPARGYAAVPIRVRLPEACTDVTVPTSISDGAMRLERWTANCSGGLPGREVGIDGLERTLIETIVRFQRLDGQTQSVRLMAGATSFLAAEPSSPLGVAKAFLPLGVEHILFGFDHLCFVVALLLLIGGLRRLVWTITSFTVGHSITLALATLGYVSVPSAPVEALIAFSIVLVAAEVITIRRGYRGSTAARPWFLALVFGLLHGLGFAGALTETGLPGDAIPAALLFFNLGVEIGQIGVVVAIVIIGTVVKRADSLLASRLSVSTAYGIGALAAFWTIERVAEIVA